MQPSQHPHLRCGGMLRFCMLLSCLWLAVAAVSVNAATIDEDYPQVKEFFPQADRFGEIEAEPPAAAVYQGDEVVGYAFLSNDIISIPAYSGKPVNMLMGISKDGRITGAEVIEHSEPILLVGIPEQRLFDFAQSYVGRKVTERVKVGAGKRKGFSNVDVITGATVTVIVVNRTIMRTAQRVAASRGIIKQGRKARNRAPAEVRRDVFKEADWEFLTGDGSIRRMLITQDEVEEAFRGTEAETPEGAREPDTICAPTPGGGERCDVFVDFYYAYLNAPTIGRNLLGEKEYNWLMATLKPGEHAIAIMANGVYSFKGSGYVRGGIFDRIQLGQGEETVNFRDLDHYRLSDVYAKGMPDFKEMGIFIIRDNYGFDPGGEWTMSLLVHRATGPLDSTFTTFSGSYELPEGYITRPAPVAGDDISESDDWPMWVAVWQERTFQIVVLGFGLTVLTLILVLQDWLVRYPRLTTYLRTGFLLYTLFVIGWYMLGQLSVVNVLTFVNAVIKDFSWETFLIDPIMFVLWSFVAVTLLLWGRGVYCGWLCPYGALQKLVNMGARKLKVPQWKIPTLVHERLWGIKYVILLVLFGIALGSMGTAERYAEVEPFKTAITLRFDREWPFILYAAGLVLISAFNAKFYCKYLCPLGAALAVPARLRLFNWLRRRKECGKPCQICAHECDIQAINDTGEINANECHYCLDCQVIYWDQQTCPPLIQRRKRREKAGRARESVRWMEKELGTEAGLDEVKIVQRREDDGV